MGKKIYKDYIEYICNLCDKNFGNKKDNYERHQNRKFSCVKKINNEKKNFQNVFNLKKEIEENDHKLINENNTNKINENQIILCVEIKKNNIEKHINICKNKKNYSQLNNEKKEIIDIKHKLNEIIKQNEKLNINFENIKQQNIKLTENYKNIKKSNDRLKKQLYNKSNFHCSTSTNINIVNNVVNNNNNIINFNNIDYSTIDKKLFVQPIMNTRLYGKAIILQMIENIYINENLPEYQNLIITDKNRGYVKIYNNGKWKTDNIQIINLVIDGIISHSKTILDELKQIYINNVQAKSRLNTSKKYIDLCDLEHLDELEDEQANGDVNNIAQIKRCKDFREMVYKDTINLFHDNKNILIKPKLHQEIIELD